MRNPLVWFRDWWRGYTDADIGSLLIKLDLAKRKNGTYKKYALSKPEERALKDAAQMALP